MKANERIQNIIINVTTRNNFSKSKNQVSLRLVSARMNEHSREAVRVSRGLKDSSKHTDIKTIN